MIQDLPPQLKGQLLGKGAGGGAFHGEPDLKLSPDFNERLWARIHKFEAAQAAERERAAREAKKPSVEDHRPKRGDKK
jgi:hypothetical protein